MNKNNILTYDDKWRDNIYNEIFIEEEYKYKNIDVEKDDIVMDLGANIGIFSLYALSKKAKLIYAFEPIKEYVELYKKNLINCPVLIYESAISNKTGKSEIIFNFQNNTILSNIYDEHNWQLDGKKVEINTISFNEFVNDLEKIDYLKVDIEGSEYDLFENISIENLKKIKKIGCEYHWNHQNRLENIINKLKNNNFNVFSFETNQNVGKLFAIKSEYQISNSNRGKININHFL